MDEFTDISVAAWARRLKTAMPDVDGLIDFKAHFPRTKRSGRKGMLLLRINDKLFDANTGTVEIVAFPHPDDYNAFKTASLGTFIRTPGKNEPQIGRLSLVRTAPYERCFGHQPETIPNQELHADAYCLNYVQSNYLHRNSRETPNQEITLSEELHRKYLSWRLHALREVARIMRRTGKPLIIDTNREEINISHLFKREPGKSRTSFETTLQQVAREFKLKRNEENGIIYLVPPKQRRKRTRRE